MPDVGPQLPGGRTSVTPTVAPAVVTPPLVTKTSTPSVVASLVEVEPAVGEPSLSLPPPEKLAPSTSFSPAPPVHGDVTIRGWFNDVFANLVATGRVKSDRAEEYLQDLLNRMGY